MAEFVDCSDYYHQIAGKDLSITSIFGTNVVENFFGVIRSKWRYLSYWEYCIIENRAWMELVKRFASDRPFPLKESGIHKKKCYNNQIGLAFKMEDISLACKASIVHVYDFDV
jgi:hypothetical protein